MKIRGKKFTVAQIETLKANGVNDYADYLLHSIKHVSDDGSKRLGQHGSKTEVMTIIHRETGELKDVEIIN